MYFSDHATEYQEVLSPAVAVCSVSNENLYSSVSISWTADVVSIKKVFSSTPTILFILFTFFNDCFKYQIRKRKSTFTGKGFQLKFLLFILNIRIIFIYKFIGHAQYQVIFSIHENNSHLHVHIFVNTIDLTNDMLYNCDMHNFYAIRGHVKFVLQSYRLWYGEHPVRLLE